MTFCNVSVSQTVARGTCLMLTFNPDFGYPETLTGFCYYNGELTTGTRA